MFWVPFARMQHIRPNLLHSLFPRTLAKLNVVCSTTIRLNGSGIRSNDLQLASLWVAAKGEHSPIWSGLTLKSSQTRNFGLKIFRTWPDRLNHQSGPNQTVLQRSGLFWSTVFYFYIFIQINKCIYSNISHLPLINKIICN